MTTGGLGDLYKITQKEQKEKIEFMKNHTVISLICDCGFQWKPYADNFTILPFVEDLKCPRCNKIERYQLLDEDTKKKLALRKLGLDGNNTLLNKVKILEKQNSLLEKQHELLKDRQNLLEVKISMLLKWGARRERDFRDIETIADEERKENEFRESNK
jgi:hypothetical protein